MEVLSCSATSIVPATHRKLEVAEGESMRILAVIHMTEEGGFWAEVPSIPGCSTQGETLEDIEANIREAIEGCLSVEVEEAVL